MDAKLEAVAKDLLKLRKAAERAIESAEKRLSKEAMDRGTFRLMGVAKGILKLADKVDGAFEEAALR